jgi:hypothetical protein
LIDNLRRRGKKINRSFFVIWGVILLFGISVPFTPAIRTHAFALEKPNQSGVAALYLYNFLMFVEWPEGTFHDSKLIQVKIFGNTALFESLKPMIGKIVKGKKLAVTEGLGKKDLAEPYHVLFIDSSKMPFVSDTLKRLGNRSILTISNKQGFTDMGGMVFLKDLSSPTVKEGNAKRFEINLTAVERAGLRIGSRLLRLSDIVYKGVDR